MSLKKDIKKKPTKKAAEKKEADKDVFAFLNKDIELFGGGINDKKKERFYSELNALLNSGIDISTSLTLIADEMHKKKDKAFFTSIKEEVVKGVSLSEALENTGKFGVYEYVSIKIGEETGMLEQVLREMSSYFERRIKLKRQMVSVFTYPSFIVLVTFGVLYFMLNTVVPMFSEVFKQFDSELPELTKWILKLSDSFSYVIYGFLGIALLIILMVFTQKDKEYYQKYTAILILNIPLFGRLIKKVYLARFCQGMHLLLSSKTPLINTLDLVNEMLNFYPFKVALKEVRNEVTKGNSLHKSMEKHKIFPRRMVSLVKVAEEVNQLENMFERLGNQYNEEVEHQTSLIGTILEPLMIIFIGLIVGLILVSMYLPLFNLSEIIK